MAKGSVTTEEERKERKKCDFILLNQNYKFVSKIPVVFTIGL